MTSVTSWSLDFNVYVQRVDMFQGRSTANIGFVRFRYHWTVLCRIWTVLCRNCLIDVSFVENSK